MSKLVIPAHPYARLRKAIADELLSGAERVRMYTRLAYACLPAGRNQPIRDPVSKRVLTKKSCDPSLLGGRMWKCERL
jgi:hypothetical protein